jgi:hypothetical protein
MRLRAFFVAGVLLSLPLSAAAEVYKYKKPDGTIVYTDNLNQLPADRREHYNKQREEREQKRAELERAIGKEELERRENEAKRVELERAQLAEAERQERMRAIDVVLADIQKRRSAREASREVWRQKMKTAREALEKKLAEFQALSEKANAISIQPDFARLPGQNEDLEKTKEALEKLEKEIDVLVEQVDVIIPDEARKAGIPPGWLR